MARALLAKGAVREGIAMLRGAVARDRTEQGCAALLAQILDGGAPDGPASTVELDLSLVDRWIRAGRLVEALALLGGTALGSRETGREWANLLGELLAPVPVDAEQTLVEMHRALLRGGASVALTLLEERARRSPGLPAWAARRLDLLRWMLLDNASVAEEHAALPDEPASALAAALRDRVNQRDLSGALEAARAFAEAHGDDRDAARTVEALRAIEAEMKRLAEDAAVETHTIPMYGHPSAMMQIRMGNLAEACVVYRRLLERAPDDERARRMLDDVEALRRALAGERVAVDERPPADFAADDEPTFDEHVREEDDRWGAPDTLPERAAVTTTVDPPRGVDFGPTAEITQPSLAAERLVEEGKLEEAARIYEALVRSEPERREWARRLALLRDSDLPEDDERRGVLVRAILNVK